MQSTALLSVLLRFPYEEGPTLKKTTLPGHIFKATALYSKTSNNISVKMYNKYQVNTCDSSKAVNSNYLIEDRSPSQQAISVYCMSSSST